MILGDWLDPLSIFKFFRRIVLRSALLFIYIIIYNDFYFSKMFFKLGSNLPAQIDLFATNGNEYHFQVRSLIPLRFLFSYLGGEIIAKHVLL